MYYTPIDWTDEDGNVAVNVTPIGNGGIGLAGLQATAEENVEKTSDGETKKTGKISLGHGASVGAGATIDYNIEVGDKLTTKSSDQ